MTGPSELSPGEHELLHDVQALERNLWDEEFSAELYRALASRTWRKRRRPDLAVALSWTRAERLVNEIRERIDYEPLPLAQTGGEGDVTRRVEQELDRLGWTSKPLDTSRQSPEHSGEPESPPPPDQGQRKVGDDPDARWRHAAEGRPPR